MKMGFFSKLKLSFMAQDKLLELVKDHSTSAEILVFLCKMEKPELLSAAIGNPNTPEDVIISSIMNMLTHNKGEIRELAIKIVKRTKQKHPLSFNLSKALLEVLQVSDWVHSRVIVSALGILRAQNATPSITSYTYKAINEYKRLVDLKQYAHNQAYYEMNKNPYAYEPQYRIKTNTDEKDLKAVLILHRFIYEGIQALGEIGNTDALNALKEIAKSHKNYRDRVNAAVERAKKRSAKERSTRAKGTKKPLKITCSRCGARVEKSQSVRIPPHGSVCLSCDRELTRQIMRDSDHTPNI